MKLKVPLLISLIAIIIILISIFAFDVGNNDFLDNGTSSDNNDNWINHNMNVSRNDEFTTLSANSNNSLWYMANHTLYDDFIVEWDNHGTPNTFDYCLISDLGRTKESPLNFVTDLNINKDSHVKLAINGSNIIPYVDGVMKKPVKLNVTPGEGMVFRFQINSNGSDICYSNFKIHNIK